MRAIGKIKEAKKDEVKVCRSKGAMWAKEAIIQAAATVFSKKGFHGATIEDIAHEANYSPAALYKYFNDKTEIFLAHLEALKKKFFAVFKEPPPIPLSFENRLRWILDRVFTIAEENRSIFVSFVSQRLDLIGEEEARIKKEVRVYFNELKEIVSNLMKSGIEEGALFRGDPDEHATFFSGIVHAFVFSWLNSGGKGSLKDKEEKILEYFFNGAGAGNNLKRTIGGKK